MKETISLSTLKALVEKKTKKKILIKVMWNENEKITLLVTPNMKINSFIFDKKEGYLFYDNEGELVIYLIPCILLEKDFVDGQILTEGLRINSQRLSKEDLAFLEDHS